MGRSLDAPADRAASGSADRPSARPADRAASGSADRPSTRPADRAASGSAGRPSARPADRAASGSAGRLPGPSAAGRIAERAAGRAAAAPPACERSPRRAALEPARLHPALRTASRLAEDLAEEARAPRLATGLAAVDGLLGGGFPRGRLSEITGPPSSGRTSLAVALAAAATRAGEVVAWVDPADALDPASLEAGGVALERLLWVRPGRAGDALRCAERLLAARGFALVVLDLDAGPDARAGVWLRLTRCAAASATALVLLGREPALGPFAALAVDLRATRARFAERPAWLEGLEARLALARRRGGAGAPGGFVPVCWKVPPVVPDPPEPDEDAL